MKSHEAALDRLVLKCLSLFINRYLIHKILICPLTNISNYAILNKIERDDG
jgi:hypothetical protein